MRNHLLKMNHRRSLLPITFVALIVACAQGLAMADDPAPAQESAATASVVEPAAPDPAAGPTTPGIDPAPPEPDSAAAPQAAPVGEGELSDDTAVAEEIPSAEQAAGDQDEQSECSTPSPGAPTDASRRCPQPPSPTTGEGSQSGPETFELPFGLGGPDAWTSPEGLSSTLKMVLLLTVISLAPALLMMTTCFVRIVVVLSLLRHALGTAQLPSGQVITSLALFMTLLVMTPVWSQLYNDAIVPYTSHEITLEEAWDLGVHPVRQFMSAQIERTGNSSDVWLFYKYLPQPTASPTSYDDVPLSVLLPAFMLSELKTAFLIGFQIYLPFLVVDLVVASVTISMGMVMLPPVLVSLPLKLLLFVLVDGWHLVVGMLLDSFQTFS
jgi:flagellar biosynthesis protein FliP